MEPTEAAWVAGILEGEACFDTFINSNGKRYPRVRLEMKDRDIVVRIKELVGGGSVRHIVRPNPNHSDTYQWTVMRKTDLSILLEVIGPWLGERRAKKVDYMLSLMR